MASKTSVNLAADVIADVACIYEEHFKSLAYLALECADKSDNSEYWQQRIRGIADSLNFEIKALNEDFEKRIERVGQ